MAKFLGIVLSPAAVQSEGLDPVLDRIAATGAHAISSMWSMSRPCAPGQGERQPPLDIDGYDRILDRPLFGQRELWLESFRTHPYDASLFEGTPYRPGGRMAPPEVDRDLPDRILEAAHARGMQSWMQVSPTIVPGLRAEDQPQRVDGSLPDLGRRVARQGCLNNPDVRAYGLGLVRDAVRHHPAADGLFLDWAEYTTYALEDHLSCFCPHCEERALAEGLDWAHMRQDVLHTWQRLQALSCGDLTRIQRLARRPSELVDLLLAYPGWYDLLRFKARTVVGYYAAVRQAMDLEGARQMALGANGWCPPFNLSSGMDYGAVAGVCQALRVKLFTFHWSVLPRWYGQTLLRWNPTLSEEHILDALVDALELPDRNSPRSFAQYHIPTPDEPHPTLPEAWRIKTDAVADQVAGRAPFYAYAHSYRPLEQWKRTISVLRDSRADGMWVQRYGYLSDAKLEALRVLWA
jgi:hypothetical protein